jgi:signal transduction histidine kinase
MAASTAARRRPPVNILLVDDQPGKLLTYETILGELGENLIRASSGTEALDRLLRTDIAVVLVDVCMPEIDGFELAAMIRSHPRYQKTAIILVSSVLVDDVDRLKGYHSGAVDYVSVPIVPEILRAKVAVFAELYRKTEELARLNRELERRVAERTRQIEEAAARLRAVDERMRLVLNASRVRLWTLPLSDEAARAAFLAPVHPDARPLVEAAVARAVEGDDGYAVEFRALENGRERWLMGRGMVIRDPSGRPLSIDGMDMDITERRRSEEERAGLLAAAQQARGEAEHANRLKDEFLATLSHELRTPLHAITGWAHLLRTGRLDPEQQERGIDTISRNAELQNQLISEILDVSRIVTGKLRLETSSIELHAVVESALETVRLAANAKRITIGTSMVETGDRIAGDPARLQQVVWNVVQNAIKFTPQGGHVDVRLSVSDSAATLLVLDDGPGIPPDFLPFVFDRFRQADSSSTRPHQGLGLGLAIVRHLVEMHGGSVAAANREDGPGAEIRIVLPREQPSVPSAEEVLAEPMLEVRDCSPWENPETLRGIRVLVVDDEADSRELVAMLLRRCGAEALLACSVQEALEHARASSPDVILSDIEMPGEDGYALLQALRLLPPEHGGLAPAAALTAYARPEDRDRALEAGFAAHVPKPIRPPELVAAVAGLAIHARARPLPSPAPTPGAVSQVAAQS